MRSPLAAGMRCCPPPRITHPEATRKTQPGVKEGSPAEPYPLKQNAEPVPGTARPAKPALRGEVFVSGSITPPGQAEDAAWREGRSAGRAVASKQIAAQVPGTA